MNILHIFRPFKAAWYKAKSLIRSEHSFTGFGARFAKRHDGYNETIADTIDHARVARAISEEAKQGVVRTNPAATHHDHDAHAGKALLRSYVTNALATGRVNDAARIETAKEIVNRTFAGNEITRSEAKKILEDKHRQFAHRSISV